MPAVTAGAVVNLHDIGGDGPGHPAIPELVSPRASKHPRARLGAPVFAPLPPGAQWAR